MAECQRCSAKSQLFLCSTCTAKVRQQLDEMPWWLNRLTESAVGQTRMSDNGGRRGAARTGIKGEALLAECIEAFPNPREEDLSKARKQREKTALAHALSAGGVNARASELLATIVDSLQYWVKDLCDSRGVQYEPLRFRGSRFIGPLQVGEVRKSRPKSTGADYALWLAEFVSAIAASEYADDIVSDIEGQMIDIRKVINRPPAPRLCGPCPNVVDEKRCDVQLFAPREAVTVTCSNPKCKAVHVVAQLEAQLFNEIADQLFTVSQLTNVILPKLGEPVPKSTLHYWLSKGHLLAAGYIEDKPMIRLADVRKCRADKVKRHIKQAV